MTDVTFAVSGKDEFAEELGQLGLAAEEVAVGAFDAQGMKYAMQETFRWAWLCGWAGCWCVTDGPVLQRGCSAEVCRAICGR